MTQTHKDLAAAGVQMALAAVVAGACAPADAAVPCEKSQIRLVNSMREIAHPYHANLRRTL